MFIKCWGSRGSIPVSGEQYLKYGGDTTCIQVVAKSGETVIIDAGTGIRQLGLTLDAVDTCYLLLTHAHWDHVAGFNFFKPLFTPGKVVEIQNTTFSGQPVKEIFNTLMSPPLFPITQNDLKAKVRFRDDFTGSFSIGSLKIDTINMSHPNGAFGFRLTEGNKRFVFLTDNELGLEHPGSPGFDAYVSFAQDADLMFHDAEYTPEEYPLRKGWGHSTYTDALELAVKAGVKQFGLFHLNQDRTDKEMDRIQADCRSRIRSNNLKLDCFAVARNMEFTL
ncbi:MAG: MBL fold metallo-hydrolase [Desulfobacteraceae bacterium]|nr:MBL fold metallo-hydrolase [Desulfobacteraceae bacterium]